MKIHNQSLSKKNVLYQRDKKKKVQTLYPSKIALCLEGLCLINPNLVKALSPFLKLWPFTLRILRPKFEHMIDLIKHTKVNLLLPHVYKEKKIVNQDAKKSQHIVEIIQQGIQECEKLEKIIFNNKISHFIGKYNLNHIFTSFERYNYLGHKKHIISLFFITKIALPPLHFKVTFRNLVILIGSVTQSNLIQNQSQGSQNQTSTHLVSHPFEFLRTYILNQNHPYSFTL